MRSYAWHFPVDSSDPQASGRHCSLHWPARWKLPSLELQECVLVSCSILQLLCVVPPLGGPAAIKCHPQVRAFFILRCPLSLPFFFPLQKRTNRTNSRGIRISSFFRPSGAGGDVLRFDLFILLSRFLELCIKIAKMEIGRKFVGLYDPS